MVMDYNAQKTEEGSIRAGLVSASDGVIFEERQRVQSILKTTDAEIQDMKSKKIEKCEADIEKLRARRKGTLKEIHTAIRAEMKTISDVENIPHNDEMEIRHLNHDELSRLETINLLIFAAKKRLQAAQREFYEVVLQENEKARPDQEKKISDAENRLRSLKDERFKTDRINSTFYARIKGIDSQPVVFHSRVQYLGQNGPSQTLQSILDY
jgi:hypothetical protein